jgi:hypothetical protein
LQVRWPVKNIFDRRLATTKSAYTVLLEVTETYGTTGIDVRKILEASVNMTTLRPSTPDIATVRVIDGGDCDETLRSANRGVDRGGRRDETFGFSEIWKERIITPALVFG